MKKKQKPKRTKPNGPRYTVGILNATMEDFLKVDEKYGNLHPFRDGNQIIFSSMTRAEAESLAKTLTDDGYWTKVLEGVMTENKVFEYRNRRRNMTF